MREFKPVFTKGEVNPFGQFFEGTSYLNMLSKEDGASGMSSSNQAASITGISITQARAADRSCSALPDMAGIRKKENRPRPWKQEVL